VANSGVSEHGAEPATREGHAVLSPCRLRLSRRQGGEMPSGGGHAAAVRAIEVALGAHAHSTRRSGSC
jgi:hypothetical protein